MGSRMHLLIEPYHEDWGVYLVDTSTVVPQKNRLIRYDTHDGALAWARRVLMMEDLVDMNAPAKKER